MIGTGAFIGELVAFLVPLIMAAVGIGIFLKGHRQFGFLFFGIAFVGSLLMGIRFFHQIGNHQFLANVSIDDVASIRIEKTTITDPELLRPIIHALNNRQWFQSNHGGWAERRDFTLTLKSNEERHFWVAHYLRDAGAVIGFYRGDSSSYWADGYAFSPDLPNALWNATVKLPHRP